MDFYSAENIAEHLVNSGTLDLFPGKIVGPPRVLEKALHAPKDCFVLIMVRGGATAKSLQIKIATTLGTTREMALPEKFGNLWIMRRPFPPGGPDVWAVYLTAFAPDDFVPSRGSAPAWIEDRLDSDDDVRERLEFAAEQLTELNGKVEEAVGETGGVDLSVNSAPWIGNERGQIRALMSMVHGLGGAYAAAKVTKKVMVSAPSVNTIGLIDNRRMPEELRENFSGKFTLVVAESIFGKLAE